MELVALEYVYVPNKLLDKMHEEVKEIFEDVQYSEMYNPTNGNYIFTRVGFNGGYDYMRKCDIEHRETIMQSGGSANIRVIWSLVEKRILKR